MMRTRSAFAGLIAGLVLAPAALFGHPFQGSIATLLLEPQSLQTEFMLDLNELDKNFAIDADHNHAVDRGELNAGLDRVLSYLEKHLQVTVDGARLSLQPFLENELKERIAATVPDGGYPEADYSTVHVGFLFRNPLAARPREVGVELDVFGEMGQDHLSVAKFVEKLQDGTARQEHIMLSAAHRGHRFVVHPLAAPAAEPSGL